MLRRINQNFQSHHVLVPQQYGFQKGLSTDNASYQLKNFIFKSWNKKIYVSGIFCNLTKAFDCVTYELFLFKLVYNGIQGEILDWFK
jgi:hypothetical protein